MKEEKTIIIAIATILIILVITSVLAHFVYSYVPEKDDSILKDIRENTENINSYHTSIVIKDNKRMLSVDGEASLKDNYHYFQADIDKHNGEEIVRIRYDFDLVDQRYKQNVFQGEDILNTNIYGLNENIHNIEYLDSARLLIYMSELLYDKKTTCSENICTYLMNDYDITTFETLTSLITLSESNQLLEDYHESINLKFTIDKEKLTITKTEMLLNNNVSIVISFDSFNEVDLNI